ncbi:hypothetical protein Taro_011211 [Colocasia esculenta]|uniref:Uncharacterized protein n=1 Tax=Colocasia esculenta TaxID=4460 RepID=A0A843U0Z5_COLES|nr:hypothetical protein [Colocasia esculenta]
MLCSAKGEVLRGFLGDFRRGSLWNGVFSPREARVKRKKRRGIAILRVLRGGSTTPNVVTSLVGCLRFSVSQAVSLGLVPLREFPTETVTSEAHPYSPQARARRRFCYRLPVQGRAAAVLGQCLQQYSFRSSFFPQLYQFTSGLRPVRQRRTRIKFVNGLTGLNEAFCLNWKLRWLIEGIEVVEERTLRSPLSV